MNHEMTPVQKLTALLTTVPISDDCYQGLNPGQIALPRVYGGQVIAQAISSATQSVDASRHLHSLHAYFLRGGKHGKPIQYHVENCRDGGSFSVRRVVAMQDEDPIFNCSLSFKLPEAGLEHQQPMPATTNPDELEPDAERVERYARENPDLFIPPSVDIYSAMDIRTEGHLPLLPDHPLKPNQGFWFRTREPLNAPLAVHQSILGWVSDMRLLATCLLPHELWKVLRKVQAASLDHALWFHQDFRVDEWIYHHMESPSASDARGLNLGRFYNQRGELIATSTQEGLIRIRS